MTPITTTAELETFCAKVRGQAFVAVDTEFIRETTYWPRLCLIQAATPDAEAVIDPLAEGLDLEPFLALLRDASIVKVFHAARQDVEIFNILNAMPASLFDTQVAAMAAGYGEQIAYDALVRNMLKIELDKSSRFTDWARRPLTDSQLTYALADVTHLAALYPRLRARLEAEGRLAWVADEMKSLCDPTLYDVSPANAWKRLKPRKQTPRYLSVYRAVAEWRERTAQLRDQPRSRILKDDAIDELASQAPTDAVQMERLRSVPKGFAGSRFGPELLETIREALRDPEASAPVIERTRSPHNPAAGAVVELLKVLLKARAEDAGVASKLIATVSDLEQIAQELGLNQDDPQVAEELASRIGEQLQRGQESE